MTELNAATLPKYKLSDLFISLICFVVMFFMPIFFFDSNTFNIGSGFGMFFCLLSLFLITIFYIKKEKQKISKKDVFLFLCYSLVTLSVAFNQSYSFTFIQLLLFAYLTGAVCLSKAESLTLKPNDYRYVFQQLRHIFLIPANNVFLPAVSFFKTFRFKKNKKLSGIFFGCLLALPVIIVLGSLLISGDAAFNNASQKIFGALFSSLQKLFFDFLDNFYFVDFFVGSFSAVVFSPFVFSLFFSFKHKLQKQTEEKKPCRFVSHGFISETVAKSFFVAICLLYVLYLISQLSYFFGAFSGKIPLAVNMSLSEYARRGFFEMSAIALINLLLIAFGVICVKRSEAGKISPALKGVFLFLCVFTMLLIITAISKMALYITEMGLTHKRILVCIADLLLLVTLVCVLLRLFKQSFPYIKIILYVSLCVMSLYAFFGDSFVIANFNTDAYLKGYHSEIDLETIAYEADKYHALKSFHRLTKENNEAINSEIYLLSGELLFHSSDYLTEKKLEMSSLENLHTSSSVTDFLFWEYARENKDFSMNCLNLYRELIDWYGEY